MSTPEESVITLKSIMHCMIAWNNGEEVLNYALTLDIGGRDLLMIC